MHLQMHFSSCINISYFHLKGSSNDEKHFTKKKSKPLNAGQHNHQNPDRSPEVTEANF